jgi:cell division septation protein DedD
MVEQNVKTVSKTCLQLLMISVFGMTLVACSSSRDMADDSSTKSIREHEKSFDPSDYRKDSTEPSKTTAPSKPVPQKRETQWVERKEKVMGFRVQLFSAANLDEATASMSRTRARLDSLSIDPGRLDMSFDAPYYKVRAGDFLSKPPADSLREKLKAAGIMEAWVVRDQVIRIIREQK